MNPWNIIGWGVLGVICVVLGLILLGVCVVQIVTIRKHLRYYRKYRATRYEPFKTGQAWIGRNRAVRKLRLLTGPSIYVSGEDTIYCEISGEMNIRLSRIFTHDQLRNYIKKHKLHLAQ